MLRVLEGQAMLDYYDKTGQVPELDRMQITKSQFTGPQEGLFFQSLSTGYPITEENRNMTVDGSVTPVRFTLHVPATQVYVMTGFTFLVRDEPSFDSGGWGNNGATPLPVGLTAGVTIGLVDYIFTPVPWKTLADLASITCNVTYNDWGQGAAFLTMGLDLSCTKTSIRLDGSKGDTFWMQVNDDLTYLL